MNCMFVQKPSSKKNTNKMITTEQVKHIIELHTDNGANEYDTPYIDYSWISNDINQIEQKVYSVLGSKEGDDSTGVILGVFTDYDKADAFVTLQSCIPYDNFLIQEDVLQ